VGKEPIIPVKMESNGDRNDEMEIREEGRTNETVVKLPDIGHWHLRHFQAQPVHCDGFSLLISWMDKTPYRRFNFIEDFIGLIKGYVLIFCTQHIFWWFWSEIKVPLKWDRSVFCAPGTIWSSCTGRNRHQRELRKPGVRNLHFHAHNLHLDRLKWWAILSWEVIPVHSHRSMHCCPALATKRTVR
jgi:hypothetical protein